MDASDHKKISRPDSLPFGEKETLPPGEVGDSVSASQGRESLIPETFGRYRIIRLLGEGKMGAVYLGLAPNWNAKLR